MELSSSAEKIRQRIITQARKQATDIIKDAEERAIEIEASANKKSDEQLKEEIEKRQEQIQDQTRRELGQEKVKIHRHLLSYRSETVDELFDETMKELEEFRQKSSYQKFLKELTIDACTKIGSGEVKVKFNETDQSWFTDSIKKSVISAIEKNTNHTISIEMDPEPHSGLGGIKLTNEDSSATIDNTLEARLNRIKEDIRSDIERLLFEIE